MPLVQLGNLSGELSFARDGVTYIDDTDSTFQTFLNSYVNIAPVPGIRTTLPLQSEVVTLGQSSTLIDLGLLPVGGTVPMYGEAQRQLGNLSGELSFARDGVTYIDDTDSTFQTFLNSYVNVAPVPGIRTTLPLQSEVVTLDQSGSLYGNQIPLDRGIFLHERTATLTLLSADDALDVPSNVDASLIVQYWG